MKVKLFFFFFFSLPFVLFSQSNKALLTDFRFIVNDTQEFPNFFEKSDLSEGVLEACKALIKSQLNVEKVAVYQAKEVEYTFSPPFYTNISTLEKGDYNYYVSVTSNAGTNTDEKGEKTYVLYLKVLIENEKGQPIFVNKSSVEFGLKLDSTSLLDEALLYAEDFKTLYITLLEHTFTQEKHLNTTASKAYFHKPTIGAYNGFLERADHTEFYEIKSNSKSKFFLLNSAIKKENISKKQKENMAFSFRFSSLNRTGSFLLIDQYEIFRCSQTFYYKNEKWKKKWKIKAAYEETIDYKNKRKYVKKTQLEITEKDRRYWLEFAPDERSNWVVSLKGQLEDSTEYTLVANRYTNYMEFLANGALVGLVKLPTTLNRLSEIPKPTHRFFVKPTVGAGLRADFERFFAFYLMAEVFMKKVQDALPERRNWLVSKDVNPTN